MFSNDDDNHCNIYIFPDPFFKVSDKPTNRQSLISIIRLFFHSPALITCSIHDCDDDDDKWQVWYEHPSIVWLLQQFPEILVTTLPPFKTTIVVARLSIDDDIQGHSGGDLASSLRYLKILSLRSTFPPLRSISSSRHDGESYFELDDDIYFSDSC